MKNCLQSRDSMQNLYQQSVRKVKNYKKTVEIYLFPLYNTNNNAKKSYR